MSRDSMRDMTNQEPPGENQNAEGDTDTVDNGDGEDYINPNSLSAQQIREAVRIKTVYVVYASMTNMRIASVGEVTTKHFNEYSDGEVKVEERFLTTGNSPTFIVAAFNNEIARDNFIAAATRQREHYDRYIHFFPGELKIT